MNVERKERTIYPLPYSAPSLSSSSLLSQAGSAWSRASDSEASLAASSSSSATGGPGVCSREKLEYRLTAPLVGEQLRDAGTVPAPGGARELPCLL